MIKPFGALAKSLIDGVLREVFAGMKASSHVSKNFF